LEDGPACGGEATAGANDPVAMPMTAPPPRDGLEREGDGFLPKHHEVLADRAARRIGGD
jgi:hypothetical protein